MSTECIIARAVGRGGFEGRYCHSDGYPTGMGKFLHEQLHFFFKGDLDRMLSLLIDEHPAGWSALYTHDFALKPGFNGMAGYPNRNNFPEDADFQAALEAWFKSAAVRRPQCYCHGERNDDPALLTHRTDMQWAYVFDSADYALYVLYPASKRSEASSRWGQGAVAWAEAACIPLAIEETPDWSAIECGQNLERCTHCSWVHFPEIEGTPSQGLSTQKWIGNEPLAGSNDAYAFIIDGVRYSRGGGGYTFDYSPQAKDPLLARVFKGAWMQDVVNTVTGERCTRAVAKRLKSGERPWKGVTWIYPPTREAGETTRG